jgi:SPP1 family predicted phage head-tail adaptor
MGLKAGKMDCRVSVERFTNTVNAFGTPVMTWAATHSIWAQVIQRSAKEFLEAVGDVDRELIVFRIRFIAGVTAADRVIFEGRAFDIQEVTPWAREGVLDLRCAATGQANP